MILVLVEVEKNIKCVVAGKIAIKYFYSQECQWYFCKSKKVFIGEFFHEYLWASTRTKPLHPG